MNDQLVAVGIGNTSISLGVCNLPCGPAGAPSDEHSRWQWSHQATFETAGFDPTTIDLGLSGSVSWRVASVHRPSEQRLAEWVRSSSPDASYLKLTFSDLPIKARVAEPDRVGMDRLVAAIAVNQLREPTFPAVIVDAGTAITVDLVNPQGDFMGGAILPGMRLISQALAAKTDQLPQVDTGFHNAVPEALGTSTQGAIRSGLFWGGVGAVRELVQRIGATTVKPPQVFLTGGDAERLAPFISPDAVFVRDLVIGGISVAAST